MEGLCFIRSPRRSKLINESILPYSRWRSIKVSTTRFIAIFSASPCSTVRYNRRCSSHRNAKSNKEFSTHYRVNHFHNTNLRRSPCRRCIVVALLPVPLAHYPGQCHRQSFEIRPLGALLKLDFTNVDVFRGNSSNLSLDLKFNAV